jgi:hypothetical protein
MKNNNKIIGEFMGHKPAKLLYITLYRDYKEWNKLMPVIEKIETMGCEVVHRVGDCVVYKIDEQENYRCIIDIQGVDKLNSAYKAVVEFIKNHEIL